MDFIPNKRAERYMWWKNLSAKIDVEGPKMGLTATQATAAKTVTDDMIEKSEARDAADAAYAGAKSAEETAAPLDEAQIRAMVRNWKTLPGYAASGSEGVPALNVNIPVTDPSQFKSSRRASLDGAQVRVDFTKTGVDAVNVYSRLPGTLGWSKLGLDTSSPSYDSRPLPRRARGA